jgi:hypothetical protein
LLIDDIDAELDRGRIEALLSELEGRTQTIVSTSRRAIANRYRDRGLVYYVERGQAFSEETSMPRNPGSTVYEQGHEESESTEDNLEPAENG